MKLGKKIKQEEPAELNEQEAEVLAEGVQNTTKVSFKKMEKAVALLEDEFNLKEKGYSVFKFDDKGKTVTVSMTNGEFDISITFNDPIAYGLVEQ